MQDLNSDQRLARHRSRARSEVVVVSHPARRRSVTLAALGLLVVATVLLYTQIFVRESQPAAAQGPPDGVAFTAGPSHPGGAVAAGQSGAAAVADMLVPPSTASLRPGEPTASARWRRVLQQLNDLRHTAWLHGDPRLLSEVYVPRSPALALDREVLRDYVSRGLRVHGVRLHFGRVHVLSRGPGSVSLRVVDRLGAMTATASGGTVLPLPTDQPTRHRIVLQPVDGTWRIAAVSTR